MSIFKFLKWRWENKEEPRGEGKFEISVKIVIEQDEDRFCATAPALPGLIIYGATVEQAKVRARDGIIVHLMTMATNGNSLPVGPDLTVRFHNRPEFGFSQLGAPSPNPGRGNWTTMQWPIRELLGANGIMSPPAK
ncbi:MAG: type II toxin-antitoxin system HicB family antitoxin [Candidatus Latescibacteria bacterium]|nr:type II toxin-antitoxin system HicB family antitoxin [Candidatus Latescibacterota bacterium]